MGWIKNKLDNYIESKISERRSTDEELIKNQFEDPILSALLNGSKITLDQVQSIPAVASCLNKISDSIAMLPIKLYQTYTDDNGKKRKKEIEDDRRVYLLNKSTGDTLNPFQLKQQIVNDYLLRGRAYIFKETSLNKVISLRYVDPSNVQVLKNFDPIFKQTILGVNGKNYENFCFISLLRNTKDGALGQGIYQEVTKALDTAYQTMIFELGLAKKGGNKKGFLTSQNRIDDSTMTKLKNAWAKLYKNNNEQEDNVIVLNNGVDFKESSETSVEMQLDERKRTLAEEIKSIFHDSEDHDEFVKNAVMPIIVAIEASLNENLLLEDEKSSFYFKFETKELVRGSLKDRYEAYKTAKETGWKTINEIREDEDKDPIAGMDIIPMNLADVVYDVPTKTYYTPNSGNTKTFEKGGGVDETGNQEQ